jgi:signal transduction histidine kinase
LRFSSQVNYLILAVLILTSAVAGLALSWTALGQQFDKYAYDFLFRLEPPAPWQPSSIVLAIDNRTLNKYDGITGIRAALADGLMRIAPAHPEAVVVDVILPEPQAADDQLEAAFSHIHNLVLSADMQQDDTSWEDPIPRFRKYAAGVGEVHADLDHDAVSRDIPLQKAAGRDGRWTLALETLRVVRHSEIVQSTEDLTVGSERIPANAHDGRTIRIRYAPPDMIPQVTVDELDANPALASRFAGKVVFAGVTAPTLTDRWMTPYSNSVAMPGVEMHANAYETLARQMFLTDVPMLDVAAVTLLCAVAAGLVYAVAGGWIANLLTLVIVIASQILPAVAFAHSGVWPWTPATLAVILATGVGAAWKHLLVRRQLAHAETERTRYQQSLHFVTHEMRTPLTAIQGSSELISRYGSMPEAKRKQMAEMINSESKRLAKMIETFLSVERMSSGQMELKQERFALQDLVERCVERARALGMNKSIEIEIASLPLDDLIGDRELMEYALYNLLTNAVKYSPPQTRVTVFGENDKGDRVALSVQDQGIGMDRKEVGKIFEKFYRTKRAEQSGEMGTGIGLSIVKQIVNEHGGAIHVESEPGKGSKFTLTLKRASSAKAEGSVLREGKEMTAKAEGSVLRDHEK